MIRRIFLLALLLGEVCMNAFASIYSNVHYNNPNLPYNVHVFNNGGGHCWSGKVATLLVLPYRMRLASTPTFYPPGSSTTLTFSPEMQGMEGAAAVTIGTRDWLHYCQIQVSSGIGWDLLHTKVTDFKGANCRLPSYTHYFDKDITLDMNCIT